MGTHVVILFVHFIYSFLAIKTLKLKTIEISV